jgi:hypothetical protein
MQSTAFWEMTPRIPVEVHRCFGRTYCLQLKGQREAKKVTKKKHPASTAKHVLADICLVCPLTLKMETDRCEKLKCNNQQLLCDDSFSQNLSSQKVSSFCKDELV